MPQRVLEGEGTKGSKLTSMPFMDPHGLKERVREMVRERVFF